MINRGNQDWHFMPAPNVHLEGAAPISQDFQDIYYSPEDGVQESRHVFIEGGQLIERIKSLTPGETLTVVELGLGSGLNLLLTAQAWLRHRPKDSWLRYIAIDALPMRRDMLRTLNSRWTDLAELSATLIERWPPPLPGCHHRNAVFDSFSVDFWWEDVESALDDLASYRSRWVDIWYLDGFSPKTNSAMWSDSVFQAMQTLSKSNAVLASFTASGDIRRRLAAAGFSIEKRAGFGKKRECIRGQLTQAKSNAPATTPWDMAQSRSGAPDRIVVIGAGIAGAQVAHKLANRGCQVVVFDAKQIASGGSCQPQGITYTRVSHKFGKLSDFAGLSFVHATDTYAQMVRDEQLTPDTDIQLKGYLQLIDNQQLISQLAPILSDTDSHAQPLEQEAASQRAGFTLNSSGIFFPDGGWLSLPRLCHVLLNHPNISVVENTGPLSLQAASDERWLLMDQNKQVLACETQVVLATAHRTNDQLDLDWLPLQPIRGQTTQLAASSASKHIEIPICHDGYIAPEREGQHCIGASYHPNNSSVEITEDDHRHNLTQLQNALSTAFQAEANKVVGGTAAIRCATADYLPIVGPVPIKSGFMETYSALAHDRKRLIEQQAPHYPGLWLCCGFGSRGLSATPLAAGLLVSQMFNEPAPLPRYLKQALSPARFLQRNLVKGQTS